ncbi:hypothetical protein [Nonomuraea endophytica]|uniref:hypothetical protein n=1 Tax=Nonomuraea endophytica TaxID=714136 RepID=UPI0037C806C7
MDRTPRVTHPAFPPRLATDEALRHAAAYLGVNVREIPGHPCCVVPQARSRPEAPLVTGSLRAAR